MRSRKTYRKKRRVRKSRSRRRYRGGMNPLTQTFLEERFNSPSDTVTFAQLRQMLNEKGLEFSGDIVPFIVKRMGNGLISEFSVPKSAAAASSVTEAEQRAAEKRAADQRAAEKRAADQKELDRVNYNYDRMMSR